MAGDLMSRLGRALHQLRLALRADGLRQRALHPKATSGRRIVRAWRLAEQWEARPANLGIGLEHGRQKRMRVRVQRVVEQHGGVGNLHDTTEVHHRDAVGYVPYDAEVVRDEKIRERPLSLQPAQQVDDVGLDRDVERRDRLVANDELRLQYERPCNPDALPLPT
jgi:hypothetical protein